LKHREERRFSRFDPGAYPQPYPDPARISLERRPRVADSVARAMEKTKAPAAVLNDEDDWSSDIDMDRVVMDPH
jgi:hypothetical protein